MIERKRSKRFYCAIATNRRWKEWKEGERKKSHRQRKEAAGSQIAMKPGTDASRGFRMTTRPPMTMLFFFRPEYTLHPLWYNLVSSANRKPASKQLQVNFFAPTRDFAKSKISENWEGRKKKERKGERGTGRPWKRNKFPVLDRGLESS